MKRLTTSVCVCVCLCLSLSGCIASKRDESSREALPNGRCGFMFRNKVNTSFLIYRYLIFFKFFSNRADWCHHKYRCYIKWQRILQPWTYNLQSPDPLPSFCWLVTYGNCIIDVTKVISYFQMRQISLSNPLSTSSGFLQSVHELVADQNF